MRVPMLLLLASAPVTALAADAADEETETEEDRPSLDELVDAEPSEFKLKKRWVDWNTRIGASLGLYEMQAVGSQDITMSNGALSAWVHAGDRFFGFLGYYVVGRFSLMGFNEVQAGSDVFDNYNETSLLLLEGGAGVDLFIVPRIVSVSVEGFYGAFGASLAPVDRSHLSLNTEAYGFGYRARAGVQYEGLGLHFEYQRVADMADRTEDLTWGGWQAGIALSFDPSVLLNEED